MSNSPISGARLRAAFAKHSAEVTDTPESKDSTTLNDLLANLRALAMHYQHAHWQSKGPNYYGDHLLFERLYGSLDGDIDSLAEKIVGYYGPDALSFAGQMDLVCKSAKTQAGSDFVSALLKSEEALQAKVKQIFDTMEKSGKLPLGLNDYLAALANSRDTAVYLLKQRSRS
jgi:starvation-inducible DNA-binding protein